MTSQLTEEERNFTRFFLLNFKVSPDVARRFFDRVFPPSHLPQTINRNMSHIISLNKSKRINVAQLEILRGVPGTVWPINLPPMSVGTKATCSKDFDLTLMICLLRNLGGLLTPSNGWDQLPLPNDTLPGADLATLKWYRNQLAHTTVTCMDNNQFTDEWKCVEKALTSLNKSQTPQEVNDILNLDLDGEKAKEVANTELKHLKKEYLECEKEKEQIESEFSLYREGTLPQNIAEANATLVEAWIKEDEVFYETKGSGLAYEKVKDSSCILVTSNSGLGKTATIRHIAIKLQRQGFEIVPVEFPEDIIKYKTKQKQVFLIDDVLGKYNLSPTLLEKWERINEKLISCFPTQLSSNKILCTLRLQIALHKRFKDASTILNQEVINLECASNSLTKEEKHGILFKHLKRYNLEYEIKTEDIELICETNYAFPLLCKLVSNDKERFSKRVAFFMQPVSLLKDELDKMSNENKTLYCTLVLCMLYNGTLSRKIFYIDSNECDEKIYRLMQICGLQRNMSKKELEESAFSAIGSYFSTDSYNIRFIHDALEETVGCHFCTFNPKIMFSECDIVFIRDRVRVPSDENVNKNEDENIFIIQEEDLNEDHIKPIYNRMLNELKSKRYSNLLMSHLIKNDNFIRLFGITIDNHQRLLISIHIFLLKVSSKKLQNDQSFLAKATEFISYRYQLDNEKKKLDGKIQHNNDAISRVLNPYGYFKKSLIHWIVAFGCYKFFRYVWSKITYFERKWILHYLDSTIEKPFFPLAVLGGSIDIVTELITSGADVNCFSEFWETPLYIAVKSGQYDMARLLLRNGAHVNLRGWYGMKIPISVTRNKFEMTSLVLEYDLNQTELHIAVRHNDLKKLSSNIRLVNIDSKTKSGWTVLHYAVLLNNLEAVEVLLHKIPPKNDDTYIEFTQENQVELFSRRPTPKVNIADNNGLTAVHLAVISDNTEILSLLLRNKAEAKVRDDFDRTPLHYIESESATKLLLTPRFQNTCLNTNRNIEFEETLVSALKTMGSNITINSAFRFICRDFVNIPDKNGYTPLRSVIKRGLLKREIVETLLENGADPYLGSNEWSSTLQFIECKETSEYTDISAEHRHSVEVTQYVFYVLRCVQYIIFVALTVGLPTNIFHIIDKESQNTFNCSVQVTESGNITLVPLKRSLYFIFINTVLFWLLSVMVHMRISVLLWRIFLILVSIVCGTFIIFVISVYNQFVFEFMYKATAVVIICTLFIQMMLYIFTQELTQRGSGEMFFFTCLIYLCVYFKDFNILENCRESLYYYNYYTIHGINTLAIKAINCTEFSFANISCTSVASNITYKNSFDFSVQCFTVPNITSYSGTLIMESKFIDASEIWFISIFCINLWILYCGVIICNVIPIVYSVYRKYVVIDSYSDSDID